MDNYNISDVQQGKMINNFNNAKLKFLKTSASIWFNATSRINQLTPKYVKTAKKKEWNGNITRKI
jgi:hypothetical protein